MPALGPDHQLPQLLMLATETALALLAVRLVATAVLLLVARAAPRAARRPAARWAVRLAPRVARPLVVVALGTAVGLASSGTAGAATTAPPGAASSSPADALPAPGWVGGPAAAVAPVPHAPAAEDALPPAGWVAPSRSRRSVPTHLVTGTPLRADAGSGGVVVRRGDTLWSLAARQLGPGATDADVAAAWPRWWHANRAVVGDDPGLLLPGTRLVVPSGGAR